MQGISKLLLVFLVYEYPVKETTVTKSKATSKL